MKKLQGCKVATLQFYAFFGNFSWIFGNKPYQSSLAGLIVKLSKVFFSLAASASQASLIFSQALFWLALMPKRMS